MKRPPDTDRVWLQVPIRERSVSAVVDVWLDKIASDARSHGWRPVFDTLAAAVDRAIKTDHGWVVEFQVRRPHHGQRPWGKAVREFARHYDKPARVVPLPKHPKPRAATKPARSKPKPPTRPAPRPVNATAKENTR